MGVDAFGRGGGGEFGDLEVEESGFEAGAAVEAEVEGGEGVDEGEFEGVAGVEGVREGVGDGGEGVVGFAEGGEVAGGEGVGEGMAGAADFGGRLGREEGLSRKVAFAHALRVAWGGQGRRGRPPVTSY